ncbi:MAG TPA: hypothetical protein VLM75_11025 [Spirochaetota bacterium]|nr:hypothetical protein [Spirochaetota bacterium]
MKALRRIVPGLFMIALLLFPVAAGAADLSVGGSVWYAWYSENQINNSDPSVDPTFLYGPVFALGFAPKWSLTAVFLYGVYDYPMMSGETEPLRRYDSDIALNYSINRYVKLFGGAKIMGYTFDSGSHYGVGPALGLGVTIPLSDSLFLLWNVSGVYGFGREEHDGGSSSDAREAGFNTTLSLAYYIESASTTITLGGRYQWFNINYEKDDPDEFPESNITFYGITFSAVYSFEL